MACRELPCSNHNARKLCVMAITHAQSLVDNSSNIHLYAGDKTSQNLEVTAGNSRKAYLGPGS